jgi:hypothetical protein
MTILQDNNNYEADLKEALFDVQLAAGVFSKAID